MTTKASSIALLGGTVCDDIYASVFKDDNPQMDQIPPGFWFGSSGRGAMSAGEEGCASLDSAMADKDAPYVYLAGGQKQNIENNCFNAMYFSKMIIRVYVYFDPTDPDIIKSGI